MGNNYVTREELKAELELLQDRLTMQLTIRMGGMQVVAVGVLATLVTVLPWLKLLFSLRISHNTAM
jgi:hypothetical protein